MPSTALQMGERRGIFRGKKRPLTLKTQEISITNMKEKKVGFNKEKKGKGEKKKTTSQWGKRGRSSKTRLSKKGFTKRFYGGRGGEK